MIEVSGEPTAIRTDRRGRVCVVAPQGSLDSTAAAALTGRVKAERAAHTAWLVIDMSGVSSVNFSAARALATAAAPAPGQCPVVVRACRPAVRWQLELAGLDVGLTDSYVRPTDTRPRGWEGPPPDSITAALVREWKYLLGSTERTVAESRRAARSLASTEDDVAATLLRLAARRPAASARLEQLSRNARDYAATLRDRRRREAGPIPVNPVRRGETAAGTVGRAVAFIEERARDEISVADIAGAAFVTVRAVQLAFRRHLDTTPLAYLRRVRLERAHQELLSADPDRTTVTTVAAGWHFTNASRFAGYYRAAYGVSPTQTLRQRPAHGQVRRVSRGYWP